MVVCAQIDGELEEKCRGWDTVSEKRRQDVVWQNMKQ